MEDLESSHSLPNDDVTNPHIVDRRGVSTDAARRQ
jgi:hypothetical protein